MASGCLLSARKKLQQGLCNIWRVKNHLFSRNLYLALLFNGKIRHPPNHSNCYKGNPYGFLERKASQLKKNSSWSYLRNIEFKGLCRVCFTKICCVQLRVQSNGLNFCKGASLSSFKASFFRISAACVLSVFTAVSRPIEVLTPHLGSTNWMMKTSQT